LNFGYSESGGASGDAGRLQASMKCQAIEPSEGYMPRKRVLLAEDHSAMAQQLRALLTTDFDVEIAEDGQVLVEVVEASMPDVIISDISMPRISGLAAARIVFARHPEARFLFVSVRDEPAVIRGAMAFGACGYVLKCDAGDELAFAVRAALSGQQYISSTARASLENEPGERLT
jgi:DNA-binding NarL/FixJ family response regulator